MKLSSLTKLTAASLVAGVALGLVAQPADAQIFPSRAAMVEGLSETDVVQVRSHGRHFRGGRHVRGGRHFRGHRAFRSPRHFRGHRSARVHRPFRHRHVRRHGPHFSFGFALAAPFAAPHVYHAPYTAALVPGSAAWIDYCSRKYRSFNPATGLYLSYSGVYRHCRVP